MIFRMMLVAVPDVELADRVQADCPSADVLVWDWRQEPMTDRAADIRFLVSEYSPTSPDAHVLAVLAGLEVVQLTSSGVDGWVGSLQSGTVLCNGRGIHGLSTAEAAIAGVLAVLRRIPEAISQQAQEIWRPLASEQMAGRRVVIIGAGDVATRIATITRAMGCPTTLIGRTARDGVVGVSDLLENVRCAEVLVIAVPLDDSTRGLVDATVLAGLPGGAVVANVARGPVVVTEDLTAEVSTGRLRAYLDVTDPEPLTPGHPLWHLPGVVLSPHTGGGSVAWRRRLEDLVCDQVNRFLTGQVLRNVVATDHPSEPLSRNISTPGGIQP